MKQPTPSPRSRTLKANRHVAVFVSLVATVSLTILLLALLKTPELSNTSWRSLMVADDRGTLETVFQTRVQPAPGRWRYVYVHQSRTPGGDAASLSPGGSGEAGLTVPFDDHFVIGNGNGAGDGEVQVTQTWNRQEAIARPPKGATLSASCISVCLVGDFSRGGHPTPAQQDAVSALVRSLQARLQIPTKAVFVHDANPTAAGVGRGFPTASFYAQLQQP